MRLIEAPEGDDSPPRAFVYLFAID